MIEKDLKEKTQLYLEYTAPQIFKDRDEMIELLTKGNINLSDLTFIVFEDSDDAYVYTDGKCVPYEKAISKTDYLADENNSDQILFKFAFLDEGNEVASKTWDGSVYPRFIRTNVDLSNSKNKYRQENNFSPIEAFRIDLFNEDREDLIPKIVKVLYSTCSHQDADSYTSYATFGKTTYDLDIQRANKKFFKKLEKAYQKKTDSYFQVKKKASEG